MSFFFFVPTLVGCVMCFLRVSPSVALFLTTHGVVTKKPKSLAFVAWQENSRLTQAKLSNQRGARGGRLHSSLSPVLLDCVFLNAMRAFQEGASIARRGFQTGTASSRNSEAFPGRDS
ncbi:unnamed protein product, partial [Ectocarpus sp. 12 AP-2014]